MKRALKPLDIEPGELDRLKGEDGIEHWRDGGHPVSQNNDFTVGLGKINLTKMVASASSSYHTTRRVTALAAQGVSIGTIPGMSTKDGGSVAPRHFNVFPPKREGPLPKTNWATIKPQKEDAE